jgi:hypothetical protein
MSSKVNLSKRGKKSKKGINSRPKNGNNNKKDSGNCDLCNKFEKLNNFKPKRSEITLHICDACNSNDLSKFFDTKTQEYLNDDEIQEVFSDLGVDSKGKPIDTIMVCDLHKVTDLFTYDEFNHIVKDFDVPVVILSYIVKKSMTRYHTQPIINNYSSYKTFMCFEKRYTPFPGTKGKFISNILSNTNIKNVFLLDDSDKNCISARKAGGKSILIPTVDELLSKGHGRSDIIPTLVESGKTEEEIVEITEEITEEIKEEIKDIIKSHMRNINNKRKISKVIKHVTYLNTLNLFNSHISKKKRNSEAKKKMTNLRSKKKPPPSTEEIERRRAETLKKKIIAKKSSGVSVDK